LQAHEQFDMTLQVNPVHIRAYYYRGVASEMMGNLPAARDDYEQALRLAPDYVRAQEGLNRLQELE
jgi:Tfp pilus assembly protein PilF